MTHRTPRATSKVTPDTSLQVLPVVTCYKEYSLVDFCNQEAQPQKKEAARPRIDTVIVPKKKDTEAIQYHSYAIVKKEMQGRREQRDKWLMQFPSLDESLYESLDESQDEWLKACRLILQNCEDMLNEHRMKQEDFLQDMEQLIHDYETYTECVLSIQHPTQHTSSTTSMSM